MRTTNCYLMKLRIKDDSIRLRLSQTEVRLLKENGNVSTLCNISPVNALLYGIKSAGSSQWSVIYKDGKVIVSVPEDVLQHFYQENNISIDQRLENGRQQGLYLLIEKDFQCLTDRPHEDESELFPNPNSTC